jgi:excisionase family DNA binding protein
MIQNELSDLICRAESLVAMIDKWGGVSQIENRLNMLDAFLQRLEEQSEILVRLEQLREHVYVFKALLTIDEAAQYLHVHPSTVYKLIKNQGLKSTFRPPSTQVLILTEDLVAWCKQYACDEEKMKGGKL